MPSYKRILLKLSGEAFSGGSGFGIHIPTVERYAREIAEVHKGGVQLAVVVGGGNFWRGRSASHMDQAAADQIGMMGTVMNALALRETIEAQGTPARCQTSIEIKDVAEPFIRLRAIRHLEKGRVVVFGRRHGESVFYHRYRSSAAGVGNKSRRHIQGNRGWTGFTTVTRKKIPTPSFSGHSLTWRP